MEGEEELGNQQPQHTTTELPVAAVSTTPPPPHPSLLEKNSSGSLRKRKHWGSVTDLTPTGILHEESEEEGESPPDREVVAPSPPPPQQQQQPQQQPFDDLASNILLELGTDPTLSTVVIQPPKEVKRARTKIVCAIGPSCNSVDMLGRLLDAGMNVARLNFSHKDHAYHLESLTNLRQAVDVRRAKGINCRCAVLLDTKGPEIRTGLLENQGQSVILRPGQFVEFTGRDFHLPGNERVIRCSYPNLADTIAVGSKILIGDGELTLEVLIAKPQDQSCICRVCNYYVLGERKNVNLPGSLSLNLPLLTEQDRVDISEFALKHQVDIISGSFTRSAETVRALKLLTEGSKIRIHAKIESLEALQNLEEIIQEADGVHVSRGDLGMEIPLAKLPLVQKHIIRRANFFGKPVVTSTQLLQSMTEKPRPTNAECTDVANAVLDGSDCVMLSAETANGKYPVSSVETMSRILVQAERLVNWEQEFLDRREEVLDFYPQMDILESICSTAVETSMELDSRLIVVSSNSGRNGLLVAKYRPRARILVCTTSEMVANQMSVSRGVEGLVCPSNVNLDVVWKFVLERGIMKRFHLPPGSPVVLVDSPPANYDTRMELTRKSNLGQARWNMVQVMRVPNY